MQPEGECRFPVNLSPSSFVALPKLDLLYLFKRVPIFNTMEEQRETVEPNDYIEESQCCDKMRYP